MALFITAWFRRARLRKYSSRLATAFVPLHDIRTAIVILDGSDPDCLACCSKMENFLKRNGVSVSAVFIDLRKKKKDTPVYVTGENVITGNGVNWFGMPRLKKTGHLFSFGADLLVNLRDSDDYTGDFISKTVQAKFKIGTCDYAGNPFDLIVAGKSGDNAAGAGNTPEDNDAAAGTSGDNAGLPDGVPDNVCDTSEKIDTICNFLKQIV